MDHYEHQETKKGADPSHFDFLLSPSQNFMPGPTGHLYPHFTLSPESCSPTPIRSKNSASAIAMTPEAFLV